MKWMAPAAPEAMELLMEGAVAMSRVEATGMRVDVARLDNAIKEVEHSINFLDRELRNTREHKAWRKLYGENTSMDAPGQLGRVIFDYLGHKRNPNLFDREKGKDPNNEAAFEHLKKDVPFLKGYFEAKKLRKVFGTYLLGWRREVANGRIHPHITLNLAESYRSTEKDPNLQNVPVRNKFLSKICREIFIPDPGCVLIESDFDSHEVRISQCYNQDPKLRDYIVGGGDMHRDLAQRLYMLTDEGIGSTDEGFGKLVRYCAKNMWVFASFYGDYYKNCAPKLWDVISLYDLRTAQGVSLFEHLAKKGITRLGGCDPDKEPEFGTFEYHCKEVGRWMWEDNFTVYDQWKKDWWAAYQKDLCLVTKTGFGMAGEFRRNQILCDPIQGSAFHCELWACIQVQKEILRRKMKSRIVNQIHDSILGNVPEKEVQDYCEVMEWYAMKRVVEHWKWITIPLSMEFEICPENWHGKHKFDWRAYEVG